jgi:serine/threonine protein kinase
VNAKSWRYDGACFSTTGSVSPLISSSLFVSVVFFNSQMTRANPFVVRLYYAFRSTDSLYLVMEYMSGGDLAQRLALGRSAHAIDGSPSQTPTTASAAAAAGSTAPAASAEAVPPEERAVDEATARHYLAQIVLALEFLHKLGVVHRSVNRATCRERSGQLIPIFCLLLLFAVTSNRTISVWTRAVT